VTTIRPCTCEYEYQDKKYGKGMRVHNEGAAMAKQHVEWTCTVCGKAKT
jgi:hypothetical protein